MLSFFLPMLCVPLLMIGIAGTTHADPGDIEYYTACVPGGTGCPRLDDAAYCPSPLSDSNYYCTANPMPSTCFGFDLGDCLDDSATIGPTGGPCGREYSCKSQKQIYDQSGTVLIYCAQVPSECLGF